MVKQYLKSLVLLLLIFSVVGLIGGNITFISAFLGIMLAMIPLNAAGYDEQTKWDSLVRSMPVSCAQIIGARYIFGIICLLLGTLLSCLLAFVSKLITSSGNLTEMLYAAVLVMTVAALMLAILLPATYKFGANNGRLAIGIVAVLPTIVVLIFSRLGFSLPSITPPPISVITSLAVVLALILLLLSYFISLAIYRRKEF